jgi:cytochrome c-type biogenesis protein CcmF
VHAFAADPERGVFILGFLAVVVGGSLLLFGLRGKTVEAGKSFAPLSRDTLLLLNNLLFSASAAMVLIGTLYPLFADALNLGKMSVGPPYFSALFILLMIPVVVLMPFGPFTRWANEQWGRFLPLLRIALSASLLLALFAWLGAEASHWKTFAGVAGATWLIVGTLQFVWKRFRDAPAGRRFTAEMLGMVLGHLGMGVFVAGVMIVESTSVERDLALRAGESAEFRGYRFEFEGVAHHEGPNYSADRGSISVYVGERKIASMHPEKRAYASGGNVMTEAAIDPGLFRDLYVALGEPLQGGDSWAVRVYVKPFIRWIWLGGLLMMAGGFIAAMDRRFRRSETTTASAQGAAA